MRENTESVSNVVLLCSHQWQLYAVTLWMRCHGESSLRTGAFAGAPSALGKLPLDSPSLSSLFWSPHVSSILSPALRQAYSTDIFAWALALTFSLGQDTP
jgi:hypothetical protein